MCILNNKQTRCFQCGKTLETTPTTGINCGAAQDQEFGNCGQVKMGRPAVFFKKFKQCSSHEKGQNVTEGSPVEETPAEESSADDKSPETES